MTFFTFSFNNNTNDTNKLDNGKPMFISHQENIKKTATQFIKDVDLLAYTMCHSLGIKRGDVVGLWSLNNYEWVRYLRKVVYPN